MWEEPNSTLADPTLDTGHEAKPPSPSQRLTVPPAPPPLDAAASSASLSSAAAAMATPNSAPERSRRRCSAEAAVAAAAEAAAPVSPSHVPFTCTLWSMPRVPAPALGPSLLPGATRAPDGVASAAAEAMLLPRPQPPARQLRLRPRGRAAHGSFAELVLAKPSISSQSSHEAPSAAGGAAGAPRSRPGRWPNATAEAAFAAAVCQSTMSAPRGCPT
eukprot:360742-Chlamydomonas_euryale.AAC.2